MFNRKKKTVTMESYSRERIKVVTRLEQIDIHNVIKEGPKIQDVNVADLEEFHGVMEFENVTEGPLKQILTLRRRHHDLISERGTLQTLWRDTCRLHREMVRMVCFTECTKTGATVDKILYRLHGMHQGSFPHARYTKHD